MQRGNKMDKNTVIQMKYEITDRMQEFINEYKTYSQSTIDYFGGKAEAMDVAKRLVNAIMTDYINKEKK